MSKRKAGDGGMAEYVKYLNDYDRKARGAGSDKDPAKDRFSGKDVRHVFEKGYEDFGQSKRDAAREVLKYAARIEDESSMGGATEDALDRLRRYANQKDDSPKPEPKKSKPEPKPQPKPEKPKPTVESSPTQNMGGGPGTVGDNSPTQQVQQDNDIVTSIYGNRNSVTNKQDNSITQENIDERDQSRYYEGSNREFNANTFLTTKLFGDGLFSGGGKYGFKVGKDGKFSNFG